MTGPSKKPIIGILGGICSGKSTVAAEFGKLGCKVIDGDKIVHQLLEQPDIKKKITASFGTTFLYHDGNINRKKLADMVFADAEKLSALNGILHPLVLAQAQQLIEQYGRQSHVKAIVLDIPLLLEVGWADRCDKLVFVDCPGHLRLKRAAKCGIFNDKQLKIRENFQISLDNKAVITDNTINNNSDLSSLVRQVAEVFSCIMSGE